jgi:hypothetical protein
MGLDEMLEGLRNRETGEILRTMQIIASQDQQELRESLSQQSSFICDRLTGLEFPKMRWYMLLDVWLSRIRSV